MKKILKIAACVSVALVLMTCAGKAPRLDKPVAIGPIKEYEERVVVKPIEEVSPAAVPVTGSSPAPKLGVEPVPRVELKGQKKKRGKMTPEEIKDLLDGKEGGGATGGRHLPELEDEEGFDGRRPIVDPFHVGEKVTMMLTYFGVSAGDATLEVRPFVEVNGRKSYHFYSKLKSSSVFSLFYSVDDSCESYVDYESLVPSTFSISAVESKQLREVRQFFDWKTMKADFWEKKVTKEGGVEEKKKDWVLVPYSQNIYTALQYIRVFQLKDNKTYTYRVSDDSKPWEVRAKVVRREILKTDLGNFKTVVVEPQVSIEGILKPMGEVLFWFTDDERKFPVKFESKIKIGKIIGYLKALEKGQP